MKLFPKVKRGVMKLSEMQFRSTVVSAVGLAEQPACKNVGRIGNCVRETEGAGREKRAK
jgi:hypothetical protein